MWNGSVQKLTCVKREEDIKPVYKALVESLNEVWFDCKLLGDPALFIREDDDDDTSYT